MKAAEDLIKDLNLNHETIVLACSYGPDSMVLFDILEKSGHNFVVAHINHGVRAESDDEYSELESLCKQKNICFEGMKVDNYPEGNFEANARDIRYGFFNTILKKYNAKYLFTAHHADDLVETVLMRLVRGSSFKGYAGFNKITKTKDYTLVRPLITYTKEEILEYASLNNLKYALDKSNTEDTYTRNRIRKSILPELKKENKQMHNKFLKFNELINEYEDYFNKETEKHYKKMYLDNRLDTNEFTNLDMIFQKRILNQILLSVYDNNINKINDKHIDIILDLIYNNVQNSYLVLPDNLKVQKFYNMIIFDYHENLEASYNYLVKNEVSLPLGMIKKIKESDDTSNYLIRLDSGELKLPLYVRTRKTGDKIEVKNLKGSKKVTDILIDEKLEKDIRDIYPIVVDSNGIILWIPGIKKSKYDKLKTESYDIILQYAKKEKK